MLRTKSGLPKHCSWNIDPRQAPCSLSQGRLFDLSTGIPWSEDFMRQYAAALEGVKAQASNIGCRAHASRDRSMRSACPIIARRNSVGSNRARKRCAGTSSSGSGSSMVISRSRGSAARTSRRSSARRLTRQKRLTICSKCCACSSAYAVDRDMIDNNPAADVKTYRSSARASTHGPKTRLRNFKSAHPIAPAPVLRSRCCFTRRNDVATWCGWAGST